MAYDSNYHSDCVDLADSAEKCNDLQISASLFAAKAAKYGALQGFLGGAGGAYGGAGGAFRGEKCVCPRVCVCVCARGQQWGTAGSNWCFLLQGVPQDARVNSAGGGSKRISWDSEWPQETMVLLHDLECTFYTQSSPIRSHIEKFVTWLHCFFY